jgi:hypothetical protein
MTKKLKEADRLAVDMLLDSSAVASSSSGYAAPANAASNDRVDAASRMLRMLDAMPMMDPPADLMAKTMRRIERAVGTVSPEAQRSSTYINRQQPLM